MFFSNHSKTSLRCVANNRFLNTTIYFPIIYGSVSFPLNDPDEHHTHRWTLYVRGPNNEDLSKSISKVTFKLHPSFPSSTRELIAPPYEVTEKGWGEFDACITITWNDPSEKEIELTHTVKLYSPILKINKNNHDIFFSKKIDKPVVHEFYDEVVFTDPTESFFKQLMNNLAKSANKVHSNDLKVEENFKKYSDEEDYDSLLKAYKFLDKELLSIRERILLAETSKKELEDAIKSANILPTIKS